MTKITNNSRGPRFFNVMSEDDQVSQLVLAPGQTSEDVEVNLEDKVLQGMHTSGEISLDGKRAKEMAGRDEISEARAEHEKQLYELRQREAELANRESELAVQMDKVQQINREAAMLAGATLADPLPPGTDTVGGPESEEALRRAGVDPQKAREGGQGIRSQPAAQGQRPQGKQAERQPERQPERHQERPSKG